MMRTSQLNALLDLILPCTSAKYWRVFAANELHPEKLYAFPAAIIVNTGRWPESKGVHWCAVWFKNRTTSIWFDSYGAHPTAYGFKIRPKEWNRKLLQGYSRLCGLYSAFFLLEIARGKSLRRVTSSFTTDRTKNDRIIERFFQSKQLKCKRRIKHGTDQSCRKFTA